MHLVVHQHIVVHQLRVEAVSNSSVLQIGTSGMIRPLSNLFNTGGFSGPAPPHTASGQAADTGPLVPLPSPS